MGRLSRTGSPAAGTSKTPPKPRAMTDDVLRRVVLSLQSGKPVSDISRECGISLQSVMKVKDDVGGIKSNFLERSSSQAHPTRVRSERYPSREKQATQPSSHELDQLLTLAGQSPRGRKKLPGEVVDDIKSLTNKGIRSSEIAKHCGISVGSVQNYQRMFRNEESSMKMRNSAPVATASSSKDQPAPPRRRTASMPDVPAGTAMCLLELANSGHTQSSISQHLQISISTVCRWEKLLGFIRRAPKTEVSVAPTASDVPAAGASRRIPKDVVARIEKLLRAGKRDNAEIAAMCRVSLRSVERQQKRLSTEAGGKNLRISTRDKLANNVEPTSTVSKPSGSTESSRHLSNDVVSRIIKLSKEGQHDNAEIAALCNVSTSSVVRSQHREFGGWSNPHYVSSRSTVQTDETIQLAPPTVQASTEPTHRLSDAVISRIIELSKSGKDNDEIAGICRVSLTSVGRDQTKVLGNSDVPYLSQPARKSGVRPLNALPLSTVARILDLSLTERYSPADLAKIADCSPRTVSSYQKKYLQPGPDGTLIATAEAKQLMDAETSATESSASGEALQMTLPSVPLERSGLRTNLRPKGFAIPALNSLKDQPQVFEMTIRPPSPLAASSNPLRPFGSLPTAATILPSASAEQSDLTSHVPDWGFTKFALADLGSMETEELETRVDSMEDRDLDKDGEDLADYSLSEGEDDVIGDDTVAADEYGTVLSIEDRFSDGSASDDTMMLVPGQNFQADMSIPSPQLDIDVGDVTPALASEEGDSLDAESFLARIGGNFPSKCLPAFQRAGCTRWDHLKALARLDESAIYDWLSDLEPFGIGPFQRVVLRDALLELKSELDSSA